ncbi:hypothetical protein Rsub_04432 [Raphidocelis subcapitata]|uniref:Uncharacterized protein n=1 Tax=Raphidocelis subcapitata TaxID=307507 RepID=A0A2V0P4S6_9CHLO|nr:hypothetical protein Rsub_04432 [Raphidocelis subcapitata]|eukprot:GBF92085.1 hypothetical protein Rsub_04432 [Raphidocelis subcapitata]
MLPRQQHMRRDAAADEELAALKAREAKSEELTQALDHPAIEGAIAKIEAKDQELQAKTLELDAKEARLTATANSKGPVAEAQWAALAAERQALAGRWMCLAEDKKALVAMQRHALRGSGSDPPPFEPGSLPVSDLCCTIVAHQVDVPMTSCCFQR